MFIKKEDSKAIMAKVDEMKEYWNSTVQNFTNKDNIRALTAKWVFVKLDVEDLLMEVKFETGWDDDNAVCSVDIDVDEVGIHDILDSIESQIKKSLSYLIKRDEEYAEQKAKWEELRKKDRLEQYKRLKAEFENV